jgi:hypothetical protein
LQAEKMPAPFLKKSKDVANLRDEQNFKEHADPDRAIVRGECTVKKKSGRYARNPRMPAHRIATSSVRHAAATLQCD